LKKTDKNWGGAGATRPIIGVIKGKSWKNWAGEKKRGGIPSKRMPITRGNKLLNAYTEEKKIGPKKGPLYSHQEKKEIAREG